MSITQIPLIASNEKKTNGIVTIKRIICQNSVRKDKNSYFGVH